MYFSLYFKELHALNSILIVATLCSYIVLHGTACFGTLHTACLLDGGGAAFCFGAASGAFIIAAGNLCKDFDVSYK